MRDYVLDGTHHAKLLAISIGVSAPQIRDFAVFLGRLVFFWGGQGFFNTATAYNTPERIYTQNTSKDVVAKGQEVHFGGNDYI